MSRKGVKARVVLARGAMFEFPDDGRKKNATSMLWIFFLLCHHETEVGPSGSLPTKPPICLVLCQLPTVTAQVFYFFFILYLGSGRNGKDLKKKKKSLQ